MPLAERRARPGHRSRGAPTSSSPAALIVEEILAWAGAGELVVSDRGVRWGLAKRLAARGLIAAQALDTARFVPTL